MAPLSILFSKPTTSGHSRQASERVQYIVYLTAPTHGTGTNFTFWNPCMAISTIDPLELKKRLISELNKPQLESVTYTDGPLLVLAGAGSGKTRVIAYRIAYLIAVKNLAPWNVLAVTFTNKAAQEMKERVESILGASARGIWIGTFHSICARMLRYAGPKIGIESTFTIYDRADQNAAIKRAMTELNIKSIELKPALALNIISKAKSRFEWPAEFEANARDENDFIAAKIYKTYQRILRENNALDFDDLLMETVRLLIDKPEIADIYRKRLQYILVDEYQDTNHPQYLFLRELAKERRQICAVGDDDQSIYRWRGATIRNILEFEKDYPQVKKVRLEQNYRSTKTILAAASHLVKRNKQRHDKTLWTNREKGEKINVIELPDEMAEAYWICEEIQRLHNQNQIPYSQFAVFYRVNAQSRVFEEECVRRQMPYQLIGATAFYQRKEIKDVIAYCQLLLNPADVVAFQRIINVPRKKLGEKTVAKLLAYATRIHAPILYAAVRVNDPQSESDIPPPARAAFARFAKQFAFWKKYADEYPLDKLIDDIVARSGYRKC